MGTETVRNNREHRGQREMRRCCGRELQSLGYPCQSKGIYPKKLSQTQTRAHFPEELAHGKAMPELRKSVRRNEQPRETVTY